MVFRGLALAACLLGLTLESSAFPRPTIPTSGTDLFIPVQDNADQTEAARNAESDDVWRSPESSLNEFPRLSREDCQRYGSAYGYSECVNVKSQQGGPDTEVDDAFGDLAADDAAPDQADAPLPGRRPALPKVASAPDRQQPAKSARADDQSGKPVDTALQRKIGRLLLLTFDGAAAPEAGVGNILKTLSSGRAGGVLIRSQNAASPEDLQTLITVLTNAAPERAMIAAVAPGGPSISLPDWRGFRAYPSPREVSSKGKIFRAFDAYRAMGIEAQSLGLTMIFGPNAEICPFNDGSEQKNCFDGEARHAAAFATAFNQALNQQGIASVMRLQPSTFGQPERTMLRALMKRNTPDAIFVDAGGQDAPLQRVARAIRDLRDMGFTRVIAAKRPRAETANANRDGVQLLKAGADLLILPHWPDGPESAADQMLGLTTKAIESGDLSAARIEEAYARILRLQELKPSVVSADSGITSSIATGATD